MERPHTTALVVDDDVCVRALLAELLVEEGFDVSQASNGFSGLRLATEQRPQVILLDLVLPEVSGVDVLHELRENQATRDSAIVIVSGNADALSEMQLADVDGVVRKPFDIANLVSALRQALVRAAHRAVEVAPVLAVPALAAHGRQPARRVAVPRPSRGRRL
jgi:DNA-binding response OmpR family regulator